MCFLTGLTPRTQIRRLGEVQSTGQRAGHLMSWPNTNSAEDPESHCFHRSRGVTATVAFGIPCHTLSITSNWGAVFGKVLLSKNVARIYRQHFRVGGMLETTLESKGKTTKLLKNLPLPKLFLRLQGYRQIAKSYQVQSKCKAHNFLLTDLRLPLSDGNFKGGLSWTVFFLWLVIASRTFGSKPHQTDETASKAVDRYLNHWHLPQWWLSSSPVRLPV